MKNKKLLLILTVVILLQLLFPAYLIFADSRSDANVESKGEVYKMRLEDFSMFLSTENDEPVIHLMHNYNIYRNREMMITTASNGFALVEWHNGTQKKNDFNWFECRKLLKNTNFTSEQYVITNEEAFRNAIAYFQERDYALSIGEYPSFPDAYVTVKVYKGNIRLIDFCVLGEEILEFNY